MQRVDKDITKIKIKLDQISKTCLDRGCKVQKTNKSRILVSGWVLDSMKWLKNWRVKGQLDLFVDVMKYVIIENRFLEALRMNILHCKY